MQKQVTLAFVAEATIETTNNATLTMTYDLKHVKCELYSIRGTILEYQSDT